ncbi:MAG: hypothetical protein WC277_00375 [Bacilli bacterium]
MISIDEWQKLDLHIHTQQGKTYNNTVEATDIGKFYSPINFYERNKKNDLKLVSVTNHNIINVIELLKVGYASKFTNTNVLPGVELDVVIKSKKRYHIILVFSECKFVNDVKQNNK